MFLVFLNLFLEIEMLPKKILKLTRVSYKRFLIMHTACIRPLFCCYMDKRCKLLNIGAYLNTVLLSHHLHKSIRPLLNQKFLLILNFEPDFDFDGNRLWHSLLDHWHLMAGHWPEMKVYFFLDPIFWFILIYDQN